MTKYKVVGREERLVEESGPDGTRTEVLRAELIVRAVRDDGTPLDGSAGSMGMRGMSGDESRIRVESLDAPDAHVLGTLTRLCDAADPVVSP